MGRSLVARETKGSIATARWLMTESGQASQARYEASDKGRETHRRAKRAWKARNVARTREHNRILGRVRWHVRNGDLVKSPCLVCGAVDVHAHHHNGYAPEHELDVVWLCSYHHAEAHGRTRKAVVA